MTKRILLAGLTMLSLAIAGCGSNETAIAASASAGVGGGDPTTVSATSATGTGGAPAEVKLGTIDCPAPATTTPIAPIVGDINDPNGNPIDENGALALLEVEAPVGFVATSWSFPLSDIAICGAIDSAAVAFVGPKSIDGPPTHPSAAQVVDVPKDSIKFINHVAIIATPIDPPLEVHAGEALWLGVKLRGTIANRTCVLACDGGGPDPNAFFSALNATGKVDPCPDTTCTFKALSVSPDPASAHTYGNDNRTWSYSVTGYIAAQ